MKKNFTLSAIFMLCMLIATPAQAQLIKLGVKGGLNLSKLDLSSDILGKTKDNMTGFFIGPMAEVTIPLVGLGVDGALLFSQRGSADFDGYKMKQMGLDIPIHVKYTIGLGSVAGIYFAVGPDFFFNLAKNKEMEELGVKKKGAQVGLDLGLGVKLVKHIQIGVNYQIPMGDSFDLGTAGENLFKKNKTKIWQVSAAYIF
jgi:hypothetical protein